MNVNTGQGMSLTDFSAALGLTAPRTVPLTPVNEVWHPATPEAPAPVQQSPRQPPPHPQVPVKETRETPRTPAREAHPATNTNSTPSELIKQVAQKTIRDELRREAASYFYREPVSAEEWLNGADGQYRTPFRNL